MSPKNTVRKGYRVFIGHPCYQAGTQAMPAAIALYQNDRTSSPIEQIIHCEVAGSLLTWGFNNLWATALNMRESAGGLTHFLLWHSDIRPIDPNWLDILMREMEKHQADVISAVVPIKDGRGLTSTAQDTDFWRPQRFTQHETQKVFAQTWTRPDLLINTGLMLVDFRKPWVQDITFTIQDKIARGPDGKWMALCEPEDWNFSRQCQAKGLRVYATRAVVTEHYGQCAWRSDVVWGEDTDTQNATRREPLEEMTPA